jgi:hypothetical protein
VAFARWIVGKASLDNRGVRGCGNQGDIGVSECDVRC